LEFKLKIELLRTILHNALNLNLSFEIVQRISEKLDKCILNYYNQKFNDKGFKN
jgi:hypothetical protein